MTLNQMFQNLAFLPPCIFSTEKYDFKNNNPCNLETLLLVKDHIQILLRILNLNMKRMD